jgi:hypothetical protein
MANSAVQLEFKETKSPPISRRHWESKKLVDVRCEVWTVRNLIDYMPQLFLDDSFQVAETRWKLPDQQGYVTSVVQGFAQSAFSFGEMDATPELGKKYHEQILKGFSDLIIDSNNRLHCLLALVNNKFTWDEEGYTNGPQFFKDLPESLQNYILDQNINVHRYTARTPYSYAISFGRINDGMPLNGQEKRNAYPGDPAAFIRKQTRRFLAKANPDVIEMGDSKLQKNTRRKTDEFFAQMLWRLCNRGLTKRCGNAEVDEMYKTGVMKDYYVMHAKYVNGLRESIEHAATNDLKLKELGASRLANYVMLIDIISMDTDQDVLDFGKLFEYFLETEPARQTSPPLPFVITAKKGTKEWHEENLKAVNDRYSNWCRQSWANGTYLSKRRNMIAADLTRSMSDLQASGIIG